MKFALALALAISCLYSSNAFAEQPPVFLQKWGSQGTGDEEFDLPGGVTVDLNGNVYVADQNNSRVVKFTGTGGYLMQWGLAGSGDGEFGFTGGVVTDAANNVYVSDQNNERIQEFTSTGTFLTKWGAFGSGAGQFLDPYDMEIDASGNVYVTDLATSRIQVFTSAGTYITEWGGNGTGNGQFSGAIRGVGRDASGNFFFADQNNNRIQKFGAAGNYLTQWGSYGSGQGQFRMPTAVATDGAGNVYVADLYRIQKFDNNGAFLTEWGSQGSGDGQFEANPLGLAVDATGNVYVSDTYNYRIQKFGPATSTPDPTTSYFVPQAGSTSTPTENASPAPSPPLGQTSSGGGAKLATRLFRTCPNNDGGSSLPNNARIKVVVRTAAGDPISGIPASDICMVFNGGTLAQGFSGSGADSIIASSTTNPAAGCPSFPLDGYVTGYCVQADHPTDSNGATTITFTGGSYDGSDHAIRDPYRKWGHYDSDIPVYVRDVRIFGVWNSSYAPPATPFPSYELRIKNLDWASGLSAALNQGEIVNSLDWNGVANAINVNNTISYWKDFDSSGIVNATDLNLITAHVAHLCNFPFTP